MLKVVGVPARFKPVFEQFKDKFTKPSYRSFTQLVGAIITMEKSRTVRGLHKKISNGKSRTAYEYFFLEAKWNEDEVAQRKADLFFRERESSSITPREGTSMQTTSLPHVCRWGRFTFHIKP